MPKRLIIVDISNFIFRAFFAIRVLHAPDGTPVNAVHGVLNMLLKLFSQYRPTHLFIAKDSKGPSFRNELYENYKANRSEPPEDLVPQFDLIRTLVEKMGLPYLSHEHYEADDIIGSACIQWRDQFDEILIASGDKDLMQFVGGPIKMLDTMKDKVYDPDAVVEKMGVKPDQIVDYLSMVGDASDNIPGMKGIGAKGAVKLLAEYGTLEKCVEAKDTFKGKKLTTAFNEHLDDALLSKKLVQIVTDIDLGTTPDKLEYRFYPSEELIQFLTDLGFKSSVKKMKDMQRADFHAENNTGETSFVAAPEFDSFEVEIVNNDQKFKSLLDAVASTSAVALHTEYDSEDMFKRKMVSACVSIDGKKAYYLPFHHAEGENLNQDHLSTFLNETWSRDSLEICSVHSKKDITHSFQLKKPWRAQCFDVIQAHFILDPGAKHTIGFMAHEYLGHQLEVLDKKKPFITDLKQETALEYAASRACCAFILSDWLKNRLKESDLEKVYYEIDDLLNPVLAKMEWEGIMINREFFNEFEEELEKKIQAIEKKIAEHSHGMDVNLNSPKQVGELLFDKLGLPSIKKTKTGYSTDVEVLEELDSRAISPVPGLLLQYRELGKLQSTYVKALPQMINTSSGRIHTSFNQHIAATGRLSSTNPNLQNIPIRNEMGRKIRKGFIATPGKLLLGADYSQVELRLLAYFSKDPVMLSAFKSDQDIHRQTASEVNGIPIDEVTQEERSKAKAVNFGLMYGQSSFGLARSLKISRKDAKAYITKYFERFSAVKAYLDSLKEAAERKGYAETMFGRKRILPDIHSKNRTVKAMAERVAINSPIQGTAADIIKLAMIEIDKRMTEAKLSSKMILQVHDELIFEVSEEELAIMKKLVRDGMEKIVALDVPLKVDMGVGVNWYDLK